MFKKSDIFIVGLIGIVGYILYKKFSGAVSQTANAILAAPGQIGTSIGGTLYEWINPYPPGYDTYYTVTFSDGSRHAIHSTDVANDGTFTYQGQNYTLKTDANGTRYAV